jgi:hypothetical protein
MVVYEKRMARYPAICHVVTGMRSFFRGTNTFNRAWTAAIGYNCNRVITFSRFHQMVETRVCLVSEKLTICSLSAKFMQAVKY